ncbi:MAG: hypothetical protein ACYDG6_06905 [Thermincolia bacterium]
MSDYTVKINILKGALDKATTEKIGAERDKENFEKRLAEIDEEIRSLGVEPDKLAEAIVELDTIIQTNIAKAEELIPAQYRAV